MGSLRFPDGYPFSPRLRQSASDFATDDRVMFLIVCISPHSPDEPLNCNSLTPIQI